MYFVNLCFIKFLFSEETSARSSPCAPEGPRRNRVAWRLTIYWDLLAWVSERFLRNSEFGVPHYTAFSFFWRHKCTVLRAPSPCTILRVPPVQPGPHPDPVPFLLHLYYTPTGRRDGEGD